MDNLPGESGAGRIEKAFLFLEMGNAVLFTDFRGAHRWYLASLELYHAIGDDWGTANALTGLGEAAVLSGRFSESIDFYKESLSLFRALGDPRGIAAALTGLGTVLFRIGRSQESEDCMRETIQIFKELEDRELRRLYEAVHGGPPEVKIESLKNVDDLIEKYPEVKDETGFEEKYRRCDVYFDVKDDHSMKRDDLAKKHEVSNGFISDSWKGVEPNLIQRLRELEEERIIQDWVEKNSEIDEKCLKEYRGIW